MHLCELFLDGAAVQMLIATDTVWTFDVLVTGTMQGCAESWSYGLVGCIENDGGATTMLAMVPASL